MIARPPLTARELIYRLSRLDPDTPITYVEWNSEYMTTYQWAVYDVTPKGIVVHGSLIESWDDDSFTDPPVTA